MRLVNTLIKISLFLTVCNSAQTYASAATNHSDEDIIKLNEYTARYTVYRGNKKYGEAYRVFKKTANYHSVSFNTSASAFFYSIETMERSEFLWNGESAIPLSYQGKDSRTFKKDKYLRLKFDYEKEILTVYKGTQLLDRELPSNVLDPLLVYEVLRLNALTSHGQLDDNQLRYDVYGEKGIKEYSFKNSGFSFIDTPLGKMNCVKLTRVRKNSTRKTHIWLATD
ncbi:DUF3108 domain-containing protein [Planctobacterium marinum]|uniref:DUF3108 domain-containing protein n=1 Tax=Planctobacterium marinum TaxID=1631968 RepID=UPI001E5C503C|nr:DUF3108 domain-containing protein [Planctobacterium marinum]MCC2605318.1 DUF3108 domain-containing protein [Planctobacterium marinum]